MDVDSSDKSNELWVMVFFRDFWGKFLSKTPVKFATLLVYLVYIAVAIWGCTELIIGLDMSNLASDDSYVREFYIADERYFQQYGLPVMVIVKEQMQYWKSSNRDRVERLLQEFENDTDLYHGSDVSVSWLRQFVNYFDGKIVDEDNFSERINEFFAQPQFKMYQSDVRLRDDNLTTYASRFFVYSKNTVSPTRAWKITARAREIAALDKFVDLDVTVFNMWFPYYDNYPSIVPNTLQNFAIATGAMFIVALLLIPHPLISLYVTFSIVSICTGIIGYMALWGVDLDMISLVNIIMCIGFCVDFSAHIAYAFMLAKGGSRNERMRTALYKLGFPITQGAVSTILAILSLGFSPIYIFRSFAKTMFLVMVLGAMHGLVILPVIMSLTGPASVVDDDGTDERKTTSRASVSSIPAVSAGVDGRRATDYAVEVPVSGGRRPGINGAAGPGTKGGPVTNGSPMSDGRVARNRAGHSATEPPCHPSRSHYWSANKRDNPPAWAFIRAGYY